MFIILNTVLLFLNVFTNNKVITTILVIVLYASNTMSIALSNDFNALVYYIGTHFDLSIYRFGMIIENTDLNLLLSSSQFDAVLSVSINTLADLGILLSFSISSPTVSVFIF